MWLLDNVGLGLTNKQFSQAQKQPEGFPKKWTNHNKNKPNFKFKHKNQRR